MDAIKKLIGITVVFILSITFSTSFAQGQNVLHVNSEKSSYDLKPYLKFGLNAGDNSNITREDLNFLRSNGIQFEGSKRELYKITIDGSELGVQWYFHAKLGNYCSDIQLISKGVDGIYKVEYNHQDEFVRKENRFLKEAILPLPDMKGPTDIFIISKDKYWDYREWFVSSQASVDNHQYVMYTQTLMYLVTVLIFLIFTILGAAILKYPVLYTYAFYLLGTSIYILIEANVSIFTIGGSFSWLYEILTLSAYGIFLLSFLIYTKSICAKHPPGSYRGVMFKVLVAFSMILIGFTNILIENSVGELFINLVSIGAVVYYLIETRFNFKKDVRVRFLLAGTLLFTILGGLIDMHVQRLINIPIIYYLIVPGLIVEFLCIGIGVILDLKHKMNEMKTIKSNNSNLNKDLNDLEKKVDHAVGAYQILVSNKDSGRLNVPPDYFDYPLTQ